MSTSWKMDKYRSSAISLGVFCCQSALNHPEIVILRPEIRVVSVVLGAYILCPATWPNGSIHDDQIKRSRESNESDKTTRICLSSNLRFRMPSLTSRFPHPCGFVPWVCPPRISFAFWRRTTEWLFYRLEGLIVVMSVCVEVCDVVEKWYGWVWYLCSIVCVEYV